MSKVNVFEADTYLMSFDPTKKNKDIWFCLLAKSKSRLGKNNQMNLRLSPERVERMITQLQDILDRRPVVKEDHDDELEAALALFQ